MKTIHTEQSINKAWQEFNENTGGSKKSLNEYIYGFGEAWVLDEFIANIDGVDKLYGVSNYSVGDEPVFVLQCSQWIPEKKYTIIFDEMDLKHTLTAKMLADFINNNECKTI